jgi:hypothetical protein
LPKDDDVMSVGMNRAVEVIAVAAQKAAEREAKGFKPRGRFQKKTEDKSGDKKEAANEKEPKKKAAAKKKVGKKKEES